MFEPIRVQTTENETPLQKLKPASIHFENLLHYQIYLRVCQVYKHKLYPLL
jgi:hypothetical protein